MLDSAIKLVRDFFRVFFDLIYRLWRTLWVLNRGFIRAVLPGQHRSVQSVIAYIVVMLEIVGLWVVAASWAARH